MTKTIDCRSLIQCLRAFKVSGLDLSTPRRFPDGSIRHYDRFFQQRILTHHQRHCLPTVGVHRHFSVPTKDTSDENKPADTSSTSESSAIDSATADSKTSAADGIANFATAAEAATAATEAPKIATTTTTEAQQQPRPIFPWRHESMKTMLPRLTPGTVEFKESSSVRMAGWAERLIAVWFLNVPLATALFYWKAYKNEMAESAAFALSQGVAGIVSNVYQVPFDQITQTAASSAATTSAENASKKGDDATSDDLGKIVFQFPMEADEKESSNGASDSSAPAASDDSATTSMNASTGNDPATSTSNESPPSSTTSPATDHPAFSSTLDDAASPGSAAQPETVSAATETNKEEVRPPDNTASKEGPDVDPASSSEKSSSTLVPNVKDMLLEPLRKLYESAHQSGRDQLIIKLQMQPISALWYNLISIPYVTRAETVSNPSKLLRMRTMGSMHPTEAFRTVFSMLDRDLERSGKLESTVELQVVVCCLESFQVLDRVTGAVLQGSVDASPQLVAHLVRLEATSIQEISKDNTTRTHHTNWQITDIDDLLGHKAWYQK